MRRTVTLFVRIQSVNLFLAGLASLLGLVLFSARHEPALMLVPVSMDGKTVVVDAGHGGVDPGGHDNHGFLEKNLTLDIARRLKALFAAAGARVLMTREGDYDLAPPTMESLWERKKYDLRKRVELANKAGADIYLSVHANCHPDSQRYGQRVYYAPRADGERLAASIDRALARVTGTRFGIYEGDFFVLRHTAMPAVLIEIGFISNPDENKRLKDPQHRARLAEAIFLGTLNYFEE